MGAGTISVWGWGPIAVELGPFNFLGHIPCLDVVIESAAVWFDLGYDAAPQGQILFEDLHFIYKVLIKHKKGPLTGQLVFS